MKRFLVTATAALAACAFLLSPFGEAQAKRFGGGRSFGSQPMYSQPYRMNRSAVSQTPSASQVQNQARRAQLSRRGGLWGMLGGLALGGLLGALLFGGAFQGINFFDILIFGAIAFLLYHLFALRRRRAGPRPAPAGYGPGSSDGPYERTSYAESPQNAFETDLLFKGKSSAETADHAQAATGSARIPTGFDAEHFLEGARGAYRRLQDAWDRGDLGDIRQLTTDSVFAEIRDQLGARTGLNRTDILKLDAELLEVREVGDHTEASALFDVVMREADSEQGEDLRPHQVREVWHFVRTIGSLQPTWFLDGIQQLES
jgi:predicted lipid-binding transport protein (Tim44 family)